ILASVVLQICRCYAAETVCSRVLGQSRRDLQIKSEKLDETSHPDSLATVSPLFFRLSSRLFFYPENRSLRRRPIRTSTQAADAQVEKQSQLPPKPKTFETLIDQLRRPL